MRIGLDLDHLLRDVLETTLENWRSTVEPDLAAVFDIRECGLKCFCTTTFDDKLCKNGGEDCFGLYKIQKGFNGFVSPIGLQVKKLYPCLTIWQRSADDDLYAA